jgi:hypothetical protein
MKQGKNCLQKLPAPANGSCETLPYESPVVYFYTPLGRLVLFYFLTAGLYQIYWFYKNWVAIKKSSGIRRIYPILRSLFAVFFCWSLFKKIHVDAGKYGYKYQNLAHIASSLFIGSTVILCLLDIVTSCSDPELALITQLLAIALTILPTHLTAFLITQRAIKFHNEHAIPNYSTKRRLTKFEWLCIILGPLWTLACVGLYFLLLSIKVLALSSMSS